MSWNNLRRLLSALVCFFPLTRIVIAEEGQPATGPAKVHSETNEDWPRWRGVRGDGSWNGPRIASKWPDEGLRTVWKKPIGGGYAGISVAGSRVLTMDRQTTPEEVERVLCFDADSGELLWSHTDPVEYGKLDYGTGPRAAPTVVDGLVYTIGAVGQMNCLDLKTGRRVWSTHFLKDWDGKLQEWGYSGSPTVWKDLVIAQPGGEGKGVVAWNRKSGAKVWQNLSDLPGYSTPVTIEVDDRPQVLLWTPSHLRAVNPNDGQLNWSVPYKVTYGVSIATPVYHRGIVLVCGYWEGSKAIRPSQGDKPAELVWEENRFLRGLMSQPVCREGMVFLLDKQYGLTCFDVETGTKAWDDGNTLTPRGRNPHMSIITLNGTDRALILNATGELILARLTAKGVEELARSPILGETWAHPGVAGRRLFARNDREILAVELPDEPR